MTPSGIEPATFRLVAQCLKLVESRFHLEQNITYISETLACSALHTDK
jgi:hypothetical protein